MEEAGKSVDIETQASWLTELVAELSKVLVGQEAMVNRLLIGLLCRGHILLEGVPGLAKTLSVRLLAQAECRLRHLCVFNVDCGWWEC